MRINLLTRLNIIKPLVFMMLIIASINLCQAAVAVGINVGSGGYGYGPSAVVWVPGHYEDGYWIPGQYVEYNEAPYYNNYYYGPAYSTGFVWVGGGHHWHGGHGGWHGGGGHGGWHGGGGHHH